MRPDILGHERIDGGVSLDLAIPENLAYFQGHFDEVAVVPGVVQIQWAVHFARQCLGLKLAFSHMEAVKFKELLLPGQKLKLVLRYRESDRRLEFCFSSGAVEYSLGRIYFHGEPV